MPHINHRRGETRTFVVRREHVGWTSRKCWSDRRHSSKIDRRHIHHHHRAKYRAALRRCHEDPFPGRLKTWTLEWVLW